MRTLLVALVIIAITFANAQAPAFTASILYSEPSMKGGALNGTMVYDYNYVTPPSYYLDFSLQVYSALFQFNTLKGVGTQKGQWTYRYGPGCPGGCETGAIDTWMPKLFVDGTFTASATTQVISGRTCIKNTPTTVDPLDPISELWATSARVPCLAVFKNGNRIVFTSVTLSTPTAATVFAPKLNCSCGKPIDVSIVIDRSGSISSAEFQQMKDFMNKFIDTFKIGPGQTQVALSSFNTRATKILQLSNDQTAVKNAINAMSCSGTAKCQTGGTSISAGLQQGADYIAKTATGFRSFATHVIIVLTDGVHNTLSSGSHCYDACTASDGYVYSYKTCGDNDEDFIPDDWEKTTAQCSTVCTDFTCSNSGANTCPWTDMARCHRDLINAREYAFNQVGDDVIIFAVGIGSEISLKDLYMITDNMYRISASASTITCTDRGTQNAKCIHPNWAPCRGVVRESCYSADMVYPERVISGGTFDNLNSKLLELSSRVCDSNAQPCGNCCGYCKCGVCSPPDSCPSNNYCDEAFLSGACCSVKNRTCAPRNPCETASCSRDANGGAGGCVYTAVTCQANTACYTYACNPLKTPTTCDPTLRGSPPSSLCHVTECRNGVLIDNQPKQCTPLTPDPCQIYGCNASTGSCYSTPKPLPNPPNCQTVRCDPTSTNAANPFVYTPVQCQSTGDLCRPNTCNPANGNCEINVITCNNETNLCDKSKCVAGQCQPSFTTCTTPNCKENCACIPATGACQCADKLCPQPGCIPQVCNTANNQCESTAETCPSSCTTNTCASRNNQCFKFKCLATADPLKINNCDGVETTTCTNNGDKCLINCRCDNTTGCVCDPVVCADPAPCKDLSRNSSVDGCCVYTDRVCPGDKCSTSNCSLALDSCVLYPICPASDKCFNRGCNITTGDCTEEQIPCVAPDSCQVVVACDPVTGCSFAPKVCNDNINCTIDTCVNGECVYTPIVCNDNNNCTIDQCDNTTGQCAFSARVCDDSNVCTTDSCDSSITSGDPCVYVSIDVATICEDNNRCTNDTCHPVNGCTHDPYDIATFCPTPTDPCSVPICIDTYGCTTKARTCAINSSSGLAIEATLYVDLCDGLGNATDPAANQTVKDFCKIYKNTNSSDCSYAICTANTETRTYSCTLESQVCAAVISSAVIIGATLGGAVIAGIVIAVIVGLGACGGASYAAYQKLGQDAEAQTHTSPLYVPNTKGGANALYVPDQ